MRDHTRLEKLEFVPEIELYLADEAIALWEHTERVAGGEQPPPFWAFAWAGGQALARYLLDHPETVTGKTVLDLAAGSGLVAIAAAKAGAATVTANEIDPRAAAAIEHNAAANGVDVALALGDLLDSAPGHDVTGHDVTGHDVTGHDVTGHDVTGHDVTGHDVTGHDVITAGDVFYSREMAARVLAFLETAAARGATVLVGDPGRAYLPRDRFTELASFLVPVNRSLEDADRKPTAVLTLC